MWTSVDIITYVDRNESRKSWNHYSKSLLKWRKTWQHVIKTRTAALICQNCSIKFMKSSECWVVIKNTPNFRPIWNRWNHQELYIERNEIVRSSRTLQVIWKICTIYTLHMKPKKLDMDLQRKSEYVRYANPTPLI